MLVGLCSCTVNLRREAGTPGRWIVFRGERAPNVGCSTSPLFRMSTGGLGCRRRPPGTTVRLMELSAHLAASAAHTTKPGLSEQSSGREDDKLLVTQPRQSTCPYSGMTLPFAPPAPHRDGGAGELLRGVQRRAWDILGTQNVTSHLQETLVSHWGVLGPYRTGWGYRRYNYQAFWEKHQLIVGALGRLDRSPPRTAAGNRQRGVNSVE